MENYLNTLFIGEGGDEGEGEKKEEKLAGKFDSPEELAKAYSELEKKLGETSKKASTESEIVNKLKEVFAHHEGKSALDGDLKEWSKSFSEELGIPSNVADRIVAGTAEKALGKVASKHKSEVAAFLKDESAKERFIEGLKATGEDLDSWQKDIDSGAVPKSVVAKIAKLGTPADEATSIVTSNAPKMTEQEALNKMLILMGKPAYSDPKHPNYKEYHKEVTFLEKKYKI